MLFDNTRVCEKLNMPVKNKLKKNEKNLYHYELQKE